MELPAVHPSARCGEGHVPPSRFGYSSLSSGLISLDLVNYRSSSHRCRCVPFVKPIYRLSALSSHSPSRSAARGAPCCEPGAGRIARHVAGSPSFFFFSSPFCLSFLFRACSPLVTDSANSMTMGQIQCCGFFFPFSMVGKEKPEQKHFLPTGKNYSLS